MTITLKIHNEDFIRGAAAFTAHRRTMLHPNEPRVVEMVSFTNEPVPTREGVVLMLEAMRLDLLGGCLSYGDALGVQMDRQTDALLSPTTGA